MMMMGVFILFFVVVFVFFLFFFSISFSLLLFLRSSVEQQKYWRLQKNQKRFVNEKKKKCQFGLPGSSSSTSFLTECFFFFPSSRRFFFFFLRLHCYHMTKKNKIPATRLHSLSSICRRRRKKSKKTQVSSMRVPSHEISIENHPVHRLFEWISLDFDVAFVNIYSCMKWISIIIDKKQRRRWSW